MGMTDKPTNPNDAKPNPTRGIAGRATPLFRILNFELFAKPRPWVYWSGSLVALGFATYLVYESVIWNRKQEAIQKGLIVELEEEEDEDEWGSSYSNLYEEERE